MNLVVVAVAFALCTDCGAIAAVTGRRRDAPEEEHHHHHQQQQHHKNSSSSSGGVDLEVALVKFLDVYYDRYVRPTTTSASATSTSLAASEDIYDQMQSDQPVTHNPEFLGTNGTDYATMKRG